MKITYSYKISAVDNTTLESIRSERGLIRGYQIGCYAEQGNDNPLLISDSPKEYNLSFNYPNPFNPTTKINYALPKTGLVTMKIYDITGREIQTLVNEVKQAGYYSVDFNGSALPSGVYFYMLKSGDFVMTKRMVLIK
ncbi:MAG: T9SS type A sorting domain-containing protein [Ignavibacteria bacterium]